MNYPNAQHQMCMDYSERTECASLIEIIRVITAKQLVCCEMLVCFCCISHANFISASFFLFATIQLNNEKEPSQSLRSALEEKARKQQPGPTKPKRKMKPGQAKTLSDLPQLSA